MNNKSAARQKIRYRIRKKIAGAAAKPRLSVFRSNTDIYAQLIDDSNGITLAAASSKQKDIQAQKHQRLKKVKWWVLPLQQKQRNWVFQPWFSTGAAISIMAV
jgi:large subunit ribosomal protein L18